MDSRPGETAPDTPRMMRLGRVSCAGKPAWHPNDPAGPPPLRHHRKPREPLAPWTLALAFASAISARCDSCLWRDQRRIADPATFRPWAWPRGWHGRHWHSGRDMHHPAKRCRRPGGLKPTASRAESSTDQDAVSQASRIPTLLQSLPCRNESAPFPPLGSSTIVALAMSTTPASRDDTMAAAQRASTRELASTGPLGTSRST